MAKDILLVCNAGMSTSMLVDRMKKVADAKGIDVAIQALSNNEAKAELSKSTKDLILLGPQVRYLKNEYETKFPSIPVDVIAMQDYGTMNGENVLNKALEILGE